VLSNEIKSGLKPKISNIQCKMDNLKLLKGVVFRTKSFKAILLGALIIGFVIVQFPSGVNEQKILIDTKNEESIISFNFDEFSSIPPVKEETESNTNNEDIQVQNEHKDSEPLSLEEPPNSKEDAQDKLNIEIQSVVKEGVKIMDMFADTDSEQYQAFKSMLTLWNPESSKWAVHASKGYKKSIKCQTIKT